MNEGRPVVWVQGAQASSEQVFSDPRLEVGSSARLLMGPEAGAQPGAQSHSPGRSTSLTTGQGSPGGGSRRGQRRLKAFKRPPKTNHLCTVLTPTSDTKMCRFSCTDGFSELSGPPCGVLQLNSNIDPNPPQLAQTPQVQDSVTQDGPHYRCQSQVPDCRLYFWPTRSLPTGGFHEPHLRFDNSL